jgi:hypothetical protein
VRDGLCGLWKTGNLKDRQDRRQAVWKKGRKGDRQSGKQAGQETGSLECRKDRRQAVCNTNRTGDRQSGRKEGKEAGCLENRQDREEAVWKTGRVGNGQGGRQGDKQEKQYPVRQPVGRNMLAQQGNQVLPEKGIVPINAKMYRTAPDESQMITGTVYRCVIGRSIKYLQYILRIFI